MYWLVVDDVVNGCWLVVGELKNNGSLVAG
jgi:hypothetical protein